jgi:DNA modification methylase
MIKLKIAVNKIDKARLFRGKKDTYLDAVLVENRDGPDQYGNDGFICEDVTKEEREAGTRGSIIGNWKHIGGKKPATPPARKPAPPPDPNLDPDDIDF